MTNSALDPVDRPSSALHVSDVEIGSKIVSYEPRNPSSRIELRIIDMTEKELNDEEIVEIKYVVIDDKTQKICNDTADTLGLSVNKKGEWEKIAIPFDENE